MTFTKQQILAAALVSLNLLVLSPCAWIAGYLWEEHKAWQQDADDRIDELYQKVAMYRQECVDREELDAHLNRLNDRLINLTAP
ncbi:MAG: hypothetical protein JAY71_18745 [Candidatus Thiodiazotropha weberae]|nr:hypothetical protein [Candidatus Thiodiazotropha weberae]